MYSYPSHGYKRPLFSNFKVGPSLLTNRSLPNIALSIMPESQWLKVLKLLLFAQITKLSLYPLVPYSHKEEKIRCLNKNLH